MASVPLLREFKGPTIRDLMRPDDAVEDLLPGQTRSVTRASDDAATGAVLEGPGHGRRRSIRAAAIMVLWLWVVGILVVLFTVGFGG